LVPEGANFGYDVLVYIGKALFLRHRTSAEVVAELANKNIPISRSEVDFLGKKCVVYLAIAHRESTGKIQQAMRLKGGYVLHVDATFDGRGPMLMSALDSLSNIVLGNAKMPSENAETIVPFLQNIKQTFGLPLALVHDMGGCISVSYQEMYSKSGIMCQAGRLTNCKKCAKK